MEKETIFKGKMSYTGISKFSDFYEFSYEYLTEEAGLDVAEKKYKEKLQGDSKRLEIDWIADRKITDYFKFEIEIKFVVENLKEIEINKDGKKIKTNSGKIKVAIKGNLIRDYNGRFEKSAWQKFSRGIYEKWIIPSRIEQYETDLFVECDKFSAQVKAYLDLEGKH
ncbi:MAG: hypothetical protein ABIA78_04105 [archaeon]